MTFQNFVILFFNYDVFIYMSKKIISIYEIITFQENLSKETLEVSEEIFENLKIHSFNHQGDSILVKMTHDCLFSFVAFVADQSIKKLNKKYDKK